MQLVYILKKGIKILGISFLCLFVAGVIIGIFYEKEIKQLVISELNDNMDTKIHVEEFDFSVLRHFPYASIEMKNVMVEEVSPEAKKDTLLYSQKLSLLFSILDVFSKNVSVKKAILNNGNINIRIDAKGNENYRFWKKSSATEGTSTIAIEKIILNKVCLKYIDKKDHQDYSMIANKAELSGNFSSDKFILKTNADLFIYRLLVHDVNYVDNKPVTILSGLNVNSKTGLYKFDNSTVKIADVKFHVDGEITSLTSFCSLDLAIKADESDISNFNTIFPKSYTQYAEQYKSRGKLQFNCRIKGLVGGKNIPLIASEFSVKNGSIASGNATINKLNFDGTFNNPLGKNKSVLNIPALTATLSGHKVEASIRLDDLPDAYLTLRAKTQIDLKEIKPFIHSDTLESLSGDFAMNISYEGKVRELSSLRSGNIYNIKASGNIDLSNVSFRLKNNPLVFKDMSGNFSLHNNDVYVKNFNGNISSSDFHLDGIFKNFVSFLLIPGQPGNVQAKMSSKSVDLDELLVNKSAGNSKDTSYILKFNPRLICDLDVNIDNLHFRRFSATDIRGNVNLNKQLISSHDLRFSSMGGSVMMDATINASRRDSVKMNCDARITKVDITRLFYEMENFDQQTMTDKNVKGKVSAEVEFASVWSNDLTLNSKSVRSTAGITVENGELIGFSPIQALARYIHVPDLNHVQFSTLKNNISIANRKIYIPNMDINTSAINISGNGTHDFDNNIDYHLRLLLSDVMGRKMNNNSSEFGEVEDDGLGHTKLFLCMRGTVDDPHFSYDRKAAGTKLKDDIAREKDNFKGILKQEFGLYSKESSVQKPKPKKREEMQVDWSAE